MAHLGQTIENPRTGQRMTFTHVTEAELRIETVNPPGASQEPVHVHPNQESGCDVVSGSLTWELDRERHVVESGGSITVPAGTPHRFWNDGPAEAVAVQYFRPALRTAAFFETLFDLARRDQLDRRGMPRPLPLATLVTEFGDEIRPVTPPWPVLRALAAVLGPIARRVGDSSRHGSRRPV